MKKTVHVHLHEQPIAPTRDSDEGGRWVTIHGTHVHIGEGGKIDKGPGVLVGKTEKDAHAHGPTTEHGNAEHHDSKAKEHLRTSGAKGAKHAAREHHEKAAEHHANAATSLRQGDTKNAQHHADEAAFHERQADKKTVEAAGGKHVTSVAPMPRAHEKLHDEAGTAVKDSPHHRDEHNKLVNQYHASEADWERQAINRRIERNMVDKRQADVDRMHSMAKTASDQAHKTGDLAKHRFAVQHINNAIEAHGKHGGVGYAAKQKELHAMKKGHEAVLEKHRTETAPQAAAGKAKVPPGKA